MIKTKKASYSHDWVEYWFIALLIIGIIIGIFTKNAFMNYTVIFLIGVIVGRFFYHQRHHMPFPRYLLTIGFILGFIVGSFKVDVDWKAIVFFFLIGCFIGYKIHKMQMIKEFL